MNLIDEDPDKVANILKSMGFDADLSFVRYILKSFLSFLFFQNQWIQGTKVYVERRNSKGRSGYSFDSIYKIYFAAFLHRSCEVIDPDMINPSIESSDFQLWHEKLF